MMKLKGGVVDLLAKAAVGTLTVAALDTYFVACNEGADKALEKLPKEVSLVLEYINTQVNEELNSYEK